MQKSSAEVFLCCGIDVSTAQLVVALEGNDGRWGQRSFPNRASGHQALILWLQKKTTTGVRVRVCLEASGRYSLDLALALQAASGIEAAVLNPNRVHRFAATLCRSKTDPADAQVLAEYARRMPFQPWHPPGAAALEMRKPHASRRRSYPAAHATVESSACPLGFHHRVASGGAGSETIVARSAGPDRKAARCGSSPLRAGCRTASAIRVAIERARQR